MGLCIDRKTCYKQKGGVKLENLRAMLAAVNEYGVYTEAR